MAVITKFPLALDTNPNRAPFDIQINGFREVLHVDIDHHGEPFLWVLTEPDLREPSESWTFYVARDSEVLPYGMTHVKSWVSQSGSCWHLMRPLKDWSR